MHVEESRCNVTRKLDVLQAARPPLHGMQRHSDIILICLPNPNEHSSPNIRKPFPHHSTRHRHRMAHSLACCIDRMLPELGETNESMKSINEAVEAMFFSPHNAILTNSILTLSKQNSMNNMWTDTMISQRSREIMVHYSYDT